jgi:hypothetical protein
MNKLFILTRFVPLVSPFLNYGQVLLRGLNTHLGMKIGETSNRVRKNFRVVEEVKRKKRKVREREKKSKNSLKSPEFKKLETT